MRMTATMRAIDETHGVVRVEDVYDTDIEDLWEACTTPERLERWMAQVTGDLRVGATVQATFTSTWHGPVRIEACEAPHHLLITGEPGTPEETQTEAWLTAEGPRTRLVVEERGLPIGSLHYYGAGWQVHLEDLGRALVTGTTAHPGGWSDRAPSAEWRERWVALTPTYENTAVR